MGIQHRSLPLWGVQFHPESISSKGGEKIFKQFLINCRKFWTQELSAGRSMSAKEKAYARLASWHRLEALPETIRKLSSPLVACTSSSVVSPFHPKARERFRVVSRVMEGNAPPYERSSAVFERVFGGGNGDINTVWLDSSRPGDPQSRFSYMSKPSWSIKYNLAEREASICIPGKGKEATSRIYKVGSSSLSSPEVNLVHGLMTPKSSRASSPDGGKKSNEDFWTWISSLQKSFQACTSHEERRACPFQTGFVGYFDYEMKEESLTRGKEGLAQPIPPSARSDHGRPAAWFGFCDRVLAYDHQINQWRAFVLLRLNEEELEDERIASLQSALEEKGSALGMTKKEASLWFTELQDQLSTIALDGGDTEEEGELPPLSVTHDQASTYRAKVEAAREYIRRGESYEICLTTQFRGTLSPEAKDGFQIYRGLRRKNPAPYSAYLNLGHGSSILSTSPERFMSIEHDGTVEMRPIKGTLARAGYREGEEGRLEGKRAGNAEDTRWCQSEDERRTAALACDPKEMAENLMVSGSTDACRNTLLTPTLPFFTQIVDLIRADLLAFCAPDTVKVPSLMQVESYESVHQLVTTIVGQKNEAVSSVEALKHCFPPGSMTGAPKVRSVEILQRLEAEPRGVYSGTLGWLGLDGAANFSVVIRTVVVEGRQVSIGGGGAITYLSEAEREWQEVLDKVNSIASTHDS
jgi:para-aminobenzoate synthetase